VPQAVFSILDSSSRNFKSRKDRHQIADAEPGAVKKDRTFQVGTIFTPINGKRAG